MAEHDAYFGFTTKSRMDKAINSLLGIVEGISIDGIVRDEEVAYLVNWVKEHQDVREWHPFNELLPLVAQALEDGELSAEEQLDIKWLCGQLQSAEYYNAVTADIQRLHAIIGAIAADNEITIAELENLQDWLLDHDHLRTCWPFDEIDSLVTSTLADRRVDETEHQILKIFFSEFLDTQGNRVVAHLPADQITIGGVCAVGPEIIIEQSLFCFTGASERYTRSQFTDIVSSLGGRTTNTISKKLNYLVIGAAGNPCWSYACYGRKVEAAMNLRKQGHKLLIIHEVDFIDTVADYS